MGDARIIELVEWAYREGCELPRPAAEIIAIEDAGGVVDLLTGAITEDGADLRVEMTVIGEATAIVLTTEAGAVAL